MSNYPASFRRKIGFIMFAIACVCVIVWARSLAVYDYVCIPLRREAGIVVISMTDDINWKTIHNYWSDGHFHCQFGMHYDKRDSIKHRSEHAFWTFATSGISIGNNFIESDGYLRLRSVFIPYWLLVILFTLLPTCVLLTKAESKTSTEIGNQ